MIHVIQPKAPFTALLKEDLIVHKLRLSSIWCNYLLVQPDNHILYLTTHHMTLKHFPVSRRLQIATTQTSWYTKFQAYMLKLIRKKQLEISNKPILLIK